MGRLHRGYSENVYWLGDWPIGLHKVNNGKWHLVADLGHRTATGWLADHYRFMYEDGFARLKDAKSYATALVSAFGEDLLEDSSAPVRLIPDGRGGYATRDKTFSVKRSESRPSYERWRIMACDSSGQVRHAHSLWSASQIIGDMQVMSARNKARPGYPITSAPHPF